MAGNNATQITKSRQGRQENGVAVRKVVAVRKDLSSLAGLWMVAVRKHPAMNGRAICNGEQETT